jgi:hypothetical protein
MNTFFPYCLIILLCVCLDITLFVKLIFIFLSNVTTCQSKDLNILEFVGFWGFQMAKRLRKGLVGVLLGGALSLQGCGSLIEAAGRENAAKIEARSRIEAARIQASGQIYRTAVQQTNGQVIPSNHEKYTYSAFTSFEDIDKNGLVSKFELRGVKESFIEDEPFMTGLFSEDPIPNLSYTLKRDGEIVDIRDNSQGNIAIRSCGGVYNSPSNKSSKKLSPGTYLAMWQDNYNLLGIIKFEIKPRDDKLVNEE